MYEKGASPVHLPLINISVNFSAVPARFSARQLYDFRKSFELVTRGGDCNTIDRFLTGLVQEGYITL